MEYDYAVEAELPVLAFLHKNPGSIPASKTEATDEGKASLATFRRKIEDARHAKYWNTSGELAGTVTLGMASIMKIKPRVGWVRADEVPGENLKDELLRLRREIDALNEELSVARGRAVPEGVEDLASGAETTRISVDFESQDYGTSGLSIEVRWDSLMRAVLPLTIGGGAPPEALANAIATVVRSEAAEKRLPEAQHFGWPRAVLSRSDYGKVINQMVALGLVEGHRDPTNLLSTRWHATPYGIRTGCRLLAVRRAQ